MWSQNPEIIANQLCDILKNGPQYVSVVIV